MKDEERKHRSKARFFFLIQITMFIPAIGGVLQKAASSELFLSIPFLRFYAGFMLAMFAYAILWQLILSKVDLSVAYSHRSMTTVWTLSLSALVFNEAITFNMGIGTLFILAGIYIVSISSTGETAAIDKVGVK